MSLALTIYSKQNFHETVRTINRNLPNICRDIMNDTVIAFKSGTNAKGEQLHKPRRGAGEFSGKGGLAALVKTVKAGSGLSGLGGAGIDTGTLFAHLASRKWFSIGKDIATVDPSLNLSGVRPDGVALQSYYAAYRDRYANGRITGLASGAVDKMMQTLSVALTKGL